MTDNLRVNAPSGGILTPPDGVLPINKPAAMTSHDAVNIARRLFGTRVVGHTGTLDPDATGVLVLLLGRAVKASEYVTGCDKRYEACLQLGYVSDTGDAGGNVIPTGAALPPPEALQALLPRFTGEIMQIPPMYSALKRDGHKLADLARRGIEIDREPRPVTVYSFNAEPLDAPGEYRLNVHCSGGTYIRTLCTDIGELLGCGGLMKSLVRTECAGFPLTSDTPTLQSLSEMTDIEKRLLLIPTEELFSKLPVLVLPQFFARLAHNGLELYQSKLGSKYSDGERIRLYDDNGFFALGEVRDYDEGSAIKPIKFFRLQA